VFPLAQGHMCLYWVSQPVRSYRARGHVVGQSRRAFTHGCAPSSYTFAITSTDLQKHKIEVLGYPKGLPTPRMSLPTESLTTAEVS